MVYKNAEQVVYCTSISSTQYRCITYHRNREPVKKKVLEKIQVFPGKTRYFRNPGFLKITENHQSHENCQRMPITAVMHIKVTFHVRYRCLSHTHSTSSLHFPFLSVAGNLHHPTASLRLAKSALKLAPPLALRQPCELAVICVLCSPLTLAHRSTMG